MAKTLAGVALPDALEWDGRHDWSGVVQQTARTLGGRLVVWEQVLHRGRPIELVAREEVAWLPLATVQALQALAMVAGGQHTLDWDGAQYTVMFARPALRFAPLWPHHDTYTGTVRLLTI